MRYLSWIERKLHQNARGKIESEKKIFVSNGVDVYFNYCFKKGNDADGCFLQGCFIMPGTSSKLNQIYKSLHHLFVT